MYRSMLYVPGSSRKFIEGAATRGADAIIVDLEDSVSLTEKDAARDNLTTAVSLCSRARELTSGFEINRPLPLALKDIEAAVRAGAKGILITKTESADHVKLLLETMQGFEKELSVQRALLAIAMIESPAAVLRAQEIALADSRVVGVLSGGEDLATEMDGVPSADVLRFPKLLVHMAAKSAKKYSFGLLGTVADYADLELIRKMAREAREHGFDGATCVHPSVVPLLNDAFQPSAEEIAKARGIIEAGRVAEGEGRGAFSYQGKMIDAPVIERAKRLLARVRKSSDAG